MPAGKNHRLIFAEDHRSTFQSIVDGAKKVETRAATVKYSSVKAGDTLTLVCGPSSCVKKVKKSEHFKTLDELFAVYEPSQIKPGIEKREDMEAIYLSFPGYKDKLAEFGIMAFTLED